MLLGDFMWWQYAIIIVVLLIISLIVLKINKRDFSLEANKLVGYLGGKDNIVTAQYTLSRFKVILKDVTKVDKDAIQRLGAKGIVEVDNQLKIIFGKDAKTLKKYIQYII